MSESPSTKELSADPTSHQSALAAFADGPDGDDYFESEGRAELLTELVHLVDYAQLLLFVQGSPGVGKSTLARRLVSQGGPDWRVSRRRGAEAQTVNEFLARVADELGAAGAVLDNATALDAFVEYATGLSARGITFVLLLDDADKMNAAETEAVALLATPMQNGRPLVRVVMFGEGFPTELPDLLPNSEDGSGPPIKVAPLLPLDEREVADYLRWRLSLSQWQGEFPFSSADVTEIHRLSKGVFTSVNQVASAILARPAGAASGNGAQDHVTAPKRTKKRGNSVLVLSAALASLAVIGIWMAYRSPPPEIVSLSAHSSIPAPAASAAPEIVAKTEADLVKEAPSDSANPEASPSSPVATAPPVSESISPEPVAVSGGEEPTKTLPAPTFTPMPGQIGNGADWLRSRNASHFTLQYAAVDSLAGAEQFVAKHGLKDAVIYRINRAGREWAVVVAGDFADMKSAQLFALDGPLGTSKQRPWARRFGVLQVELASQVGSISASQ